MPPRATVGPKRRSVMVNSQCGRYSRQSDQRNRKYKLWKSSSLCAGFPSPAVSATRARGGWCHPQTLHALTWAPTGGSAASHNWQWDGFEMLIKHNLPHSPPDCGLCMRRRRLLTRGGILQGSSRWYGYSIIMHQNSRPLLQRCSC